MVYMGSGLTYQSSVNMWHVAHLWWDTTMIISEVKCIFWRQHAWSIKTHLMIQIFFSHPYLTKFQHSPQLWKDKQIFFGRKNHFETFLKFKNSESWLSVEMPDSSFSTNSCSYYRGICHLVIFYDQSKTWYNLCPGKRDVNGQSQL